MTSANDGVLAWQFFTICYFFVRKFSSHRWTTLTKASNSKFWRFFSLSWTRRLNNLTISRLIWTLWRLCDVILMVSGAGRLTKVALLWVRSHLVTRWNTIRMMDGMIYNLDKLDNSDKKIPQYIPTCWNDRKKYIYPQIKLIHVCQLTVLINNTSHVFSISIASYNVFKVWDNGLGTWFKMHILLAIWCRWNFDDT